MNTFNAFLTVVAEWCLLPFASSPLWALLVLSAVTGILMSLAFKYTSNQSAMGTVLDRGQGHVLAIKLFKDDLSGMFRSLANVFRYVLLRLWYSISPVLFMIVPLMFLLSQLFLRYEYRPLALGEEAIVELQLNDEAWGPYQNTNIEVGPEFTVETDAVRDEELRSIFWRIRASQPAISQIRWKLGMETVEKSLVSAVDLQPLQQVSQRRPGPGWLDRTWYAGEPSFGKFSPVAAAVVHYPRRETPIFGYDLPWWVTFFIVSIVAALAAQPILKVRF